MRLIWWDLVSWSLMRILISWGNSQENPHLAKSHETRLRPSPTHHTHESAACRFPTQILIFVNNTLVCPSRWTSAILFYLVLWFWFTPTTETNHDQLPKSWRKLHGGIRFLQLYGRINYFGLLVRSRRRFILVFVLELSSKRRLTCRHEALRLVRACWSLLLF